MAIYHLRFGLVQRSKGQSAMAVAAGRARVRLHDRRLDRTQAPLPAKRGTMPILSKVLLPDGAPDRWHNREALWNEVEACERRRDACLAREVEFAFPAELLPYQAAALARDYVQVAFAAEGMAADLNVHWALRPDGHPSPMPRSCSRCAARTPRASGSRSGLGTTAQPPCGGANSGR